MIRPTIQIAIALLIIALASCSPNEDTAKNVQIVETFMALLDAQRFDELESVLCPHLAVRLSGTDLTRDELIQRARGVYERFPDFRHEIEDVFGVADKVVLRATDYATQAETGRSVTVGQISIYRIDDGCIGEWWEEFDRYGFNEQLDTPALANDDTQAIQDLRDSYMNSQEAGDAAGCVSHWDEDGTILPPNRPAVQGKEGLMGFYSGVFERVSLKGTVEYNEIVVLDGWAFATGSYQTTATPKDGGDPTFDEGKILEVHKRQSDGSWKFYRHTWTSDLNL